MPRLAAVLTRAAVATARAGWNVLPSRARRHLEDRFFGAVAHATRVTNDGYPQPAELIPKGGDGPRTEGGVPAYRRAKGKE